jgi:DNA-binding response OmpR family regulator
MVAGAEKWMARMKALIVEDAKDIAEVIETTLLVRWPDAQIWKSNDGGKAPGMVEAHSPDVVLLDLGLPDIDGFDVLKRVREFSDVPVIILTARGDEVSRVKGLEAGADDYVIKPFSHIELLARIRAVLRRTHMPELRSGDPTVAVGNLVIDIGGHTLRVDGDDVSLTPNEWALLAYFVRNRGQVAQHQVLAEKVWGSDFVDPSVIKTAVRRLRQKLRATESNEIIRTHRGLGYSFIQAD